MGCAVPLNPLSCQDTACGQSGYCSRYPPPQPHYIMRFIFWNIRGFGHAGRRTQLKEFIREEGIDVVGLQETIKADFSHRDLLAVDPLERFAW